VLLNLEGDGSVSHSPFNIIVYFIDTIPSKVYNFKAFSTGTMTLIIYKF